MMLNHPGTVIPSGFSTPVMEVLPAVVDRIVEALDPEKIILFGSYAYGEPTPDSDVDLLVIMETEAPPVERSVTVSLLLWPRPFPVDIIVKRPDEIKRAIEKGDFFIEEIVAKGRIFYERSH
jgi:predicted nucleotidyltransferase